MGYEAVSISASDIDNSTDFLEETLNEGFPWVSANLVDKQGKPVSKPYIIKTINSLKVAIIGLTETIRPSSKYSTLDYAKPLTIQLKQLTAESDVIILLSNLPEKVNQKIATQFPEIDILISSDTTFGKMVPKVVNNTLITQTSSRGKYLGKLDIEWNSGNAWYNKRLLPFSELIKKRTAIESQLVQIEKNQSNKRKVSRLQLQQQRLEKEIETRSAEENERGDRPYNKHKLRFIPIQPTHSPETIESIVQNIDKSIKEQSAKN